MNDDYLERTDRENRLPGWARQLLATLRTRVKHAEDQAAESYSAASARAGYLDPQTASVVIDVPGADSLGLPGNTEIMFRLPDSSVVSVRLDRDGIMLDASGDLVLRPQAAGFLTLVQVEPPAKQVTNSRATPGYGNGQRQPLPQ